MPNQKAKDVFFQAIEFDGDLKTFLDEHCGGDQDLRREVEDLLAAHQKAGVFLGGSASASPTQSLAATLKEQAGTKIGPYKLLQQIGEGGFGVVYLAEQSEPIRRKVALKIIKPGMDTKEVIARFEAERQALAMMDHPNIAKVLDGGTTESGRPYFVMELVKGIPLTEFCDKNRLNTKDRLRLFASICKAIQHAHNKGVIHRDIKPSNVMVTLHDGEPVPKVIDFGVAKAITSQLTDKTMFTAYGQMIGTPQYMSPEQAEMSGLDIDTRSDVYSLGVLLYEVLTGTTPLTPESIRGKAYGEMQRMIREDEPPRPSIRLSSLGDASASIAANRNSEINKLGTIVRGELDWIVMKSLEKNRERRYETANGLAADVERYLNHEAVEACPPSVGYIISKLARRHRGLLSVAAAFLLLITLSSVVAWGLLIDARSARQALADSSEELKLERDAAIEAQGAADEAREAAIKQKQQAEQEKQRAVEAESKILQQAYDHGILLAGQAFQENDLARARQLLNSCPDRHRAWEWHWISRQVDDRFQPMDVPPGDRVMNTFGYSPDGQRMVQLRGDKPTQLVLKNVRTDEEIWRREFGRANSPRFVGESGRFIRVEQAVYSDTNAPTLKSAANSDDDSRTASGNPSSVLIKASTGKTIFTADGSKGRLVLNDDESGFRILRHASDGIEVEEWSLRGEAAELQNTFTLKVPNDQAAELLSSYRRNLPYPLKVILSEDCQCLYLASRQNSDTLVQCWDTQRGEYIWEKEIEHDIPRNLSGEIQHNFVLDELQRQLILLARWNFRVQITDLHTIHPARAFRIDATNGEIISSQTCPLANSKKHSISADGRFVASSNDGRTVCVWDPATGEEINRYLNDGLMIFGPTIRSGHLWLPAGRIKVSPKSSAAILRGHKHRVVSLAFDPSGDQIVSTSTDETVRLWNVNDRSETMCIPVRSPGIARFDSDERVVHKSLGGVQVRSIQDNASSVILLPSSQELQPLPIGINNELIGLNQGHLRRWDLATGELISELQLSISSQQRTARLGPWAGSRTPMSFLGGEHSYGISEDRKRAAVILRRGKLLVCEAESGQTSTIDVNLSPDAWRYPPLFQPGTCNVVAVTDLREIRLLDLDKEKDIARLCGHSAMITSIAFSPDGKRLFSIDREGRLAVWNTHNGEQLLQIPKAVKGGEPVVAMAISPDGQTVALGDFNEIRLLEAKTPEEERLERHRVVSEAAEYVEQCFGQTRFVSQVLEMIRQDENLSPALRTETSRIAKTQGDLSLAAATLATESHLNEFEQRYKSITSEAMELLRRTIEDAGWLAPHETMQDREWRMSRLFFRLSELEQSKTQFDELLDELRGMTPETASVARFQAELAGGKSDWLQTAKSLDDALDLAHSGSRAWYQYAFLRALVHLQLGEIEAYNALCREAETSTGLQANPENTLRLTMMCLMHEECVVSLEKLHRLLDGIDPTKLNGPLVQEHTIVSGILDYREGEYAAAFEKLNSFNRDQRSPRNRGSRFSTMNSAISTYFSADVLQFATTELFVALSAKQAGDEEKATRRLEDADTKLPPFMWQHKLAYDIVRGEAARVFGQETTITPTAYGWSSVARKPPFDWPVAIRTTDEAHSGKASLLIEWEAKGRPKNSGVVSQVVSAAPYLGKRIRLSAYAKSHAVRSGGLWMRVDGSQEKRPLDNMTNRAIRGTKEWQAYSIVLDVPDDATSIVIGGLMFGRGQLWFDDFVLETVGQDVPVTDTDQTQPELTDEQQSRMREAAKQFHEGVVNGGFEQPQRLVGLHLTIIDGKLTIDHVFPGSVGESAGFQIGDIVVSVDATAVHNVTEFIDAMHEGDRTKEVTLRVDGEEKTVAVKFPE